MENLWENETEYVGVKLNPSEASLISKILGKLSYEDLIKWGLSKNEADQVNNLWVEFSA